jgi:hypothetical protein
MNAQDYRVYLAGQALAGEMVRIAIQENDKSVAMAWRDDEADQCAARCVSFADAILVEIGVDINPDAPDLMMDKMAEDARDIEAEQDRAPRNNEEGPV